MENISPLNQFSIFNIIKLIIKYNNVYIDLSITNLTLIFIIFIINIIMIFSPNNKKELYNINNKNKLMSYLILFIQDTIKENSKVYVFFPILINLFIFVLFSNILGLIPYNFTITTQLILIVFISLNIILTSTLINIEKRGLGFFQLFVPSGLKEDKKGINSIIIPLIFIIELISYISRIISLSARLLINMLAGHILMKIIIIFINVLIIPYSSIISLIVIIPIYILETAIAFIQSYIFILLTINYLKESL